MCFMKSYLYAMDSSRRATLSSGSRVRIALPKSSVAGHQQLDVAAHDSSAFGWPSAMYAMSVCGHSGVVPLGGRHTFSSCFGSFNVLATS